MANFSWFENYGSDMNFSIKTPPKIPDKTVIQGPSPRVVMDDEINEIEKEDKKRTSWNYQKYFLTYKTHLSKDYVRKYAIDNWGTKGKDKNTIKDIFIAHELGTNDPIMPYAHTHIIVQFHRKFKTEDCSYFDLCGEHCNIKPIKSVNWFKALNYICKEDMDCKNEIKKCKQNMSMKVDLIQSAPDLNEAIRNNAKTYNDITGIEKIYAMKKPNVKDDGWKPHHPWHFEFLEEFEVGKPQEHRKIFWYVDVNGHMGKNKIGRYLQLKHPRDWISHTDFGVVREAANIIKSDVDRGWTGYACIVNLVRAAEHHKRMYTYLEAIKDSEITSTKFVGGKVWIPRYPHLIVFANFTPRLEELSYDKLEVRVIEKDGSCRPWRGEKISRPPPNIGSKYPEYVIDDNTAHYAPYQSSLMYNEKLAKAATTLDSVSAMKRQYLARGPNMIDLCTPRTMSCPSTPNVVTLE